MSAVASVTIGGAIVTTTPRRVASPMSMSEGVTAIDAIARRSAFAPMTARSILSCMRANKTSQFLTPASNFSRGMIWLESGLTVTSAKGRRRSSAPAAIGCVTKMRGRFISGSIGRFRPRRRPRPSRRPGWFEWRRARQAPWEPLARAPVQRDAMSIRPVR